MGDCSLHVPLEVAGAGRPIGCHVRSQCRGRELRGSDKVFGLDHVHGPERNEGAPDEMSSASLTCRSGHADHLLDNATPRRGDATSNGAS